MTLCAWSTLSSGCAASIPLSASVTTSSGALISFFMASYLPSGSSVRSRSGRRNGCGESRLGIAEVDTGLGDLSVGRRVGDQPVRVGSGDAGEQFGEQVDGNLVPLHAAARKLLNEHRPEGARGVDRGARCRRDGDDRREHDEADSGSGEAGRGFAMDDAEDGEDKDERTDELSGERLRPADVAVARDPQTDVTRLVPEDSDDGRGAESRARGLGGDVGRNLRPRELAGHREPERHRRVDVIAADMAEGVDGGDDDGAEGQGDHAQVGHRERRVAVDDQRGRDSAHADEDQERCADELRGKPLGPSVLVEHGALPDSEWLSTMSNVSRTLQLCFTADKVFSENLEPA